MTYFVTIEDLKNKDRDRLADELDKLGLRVQMFLVDTLVCIGERHDEELINKIKRLPGVSDVFTEKGQVRLCQKKPDVIQGKVEIVNRDEEISFSRTDITISDKFNVKHSPDELPEDEEDEDESFEDLQSRDEI